MPEHHYALSLSLLIHAEKLHRLDIVGFELCMAEAIEKYLGARGYSEDKMADLYARMAERCTADMMHSDLRRACSVCLFQNDLWSNV